MKKTLSTTSSNDPTSSSAKFTTSINNPSTFYIATPPTQNAKTCSYNFLICPINTQFYPFSYDNSLSGILKFPYTDISNYDQKFTSPGLKNKHHTCSAANKNPLRQVLSPQSPRHQFLGTQLCLCLLQLHHRSEQLSQLFPRPQLLQQPMSSNSNPMTVQTTFSTALASQTPAVVPQLNRSPDMTRKLGSRRLTQLLVV